MPFTFEKTNLDGVVVVKPKIFGDDRGFFLETFSKKGFESAGLDMNVVQINHSRSGRGVLRGLHFQRPPFEQAKLVRCLRGTILDVAVDIRPGSASFGGHCSTSLSESNRSLLYVPRGFAHGFVVVDDFAEVEYAVDNVYASDHEAGIIWNDPDLSVSWPVERPVLSEKDEKWPTLRDVKRQLFERRDTPTGIDFARPSVLKET